MKSGSVDKKNEKNEELDVNKFKELINEMYKSFPNAIYAEDKINEVVKTDIMREHLVKTGVLLKELYKSGAKTKNQYFLGENALHLISAWRTEKLTENIKYLTFWLIFLTILLISIEVQIHFSAWLVILVISLIVIFILFFRNH